MNSGSRARCGMEALDPDEALKAPGAGEAREVHGRHAAGRELRDELEAVEPSALAFDGNELAAQDFGSRAKVMVIIMTSRRAQKVPSTPARPIPRTGTTMRAAPARRALRP